MTVIMDQNRCLKYKKTSYVPNITHISLFGTFKCKSYMGTFVMYFRTSLFDKKNL